MGQLRTANKRHVRILARTQKILKQTATKVAPAAKPAKA